MVERQKRGIPHIFYLYLHSKLKEHAERNLMSLNEFKWRMFQWKIPKQIKPLIVREMELLELIKKKGKRKIRFLDSGFRLDNLNNFFQQLNLF
jgi:hypothetical protein